MYCVHAWVCVCIVYLCVSVCDCDVCMYDEGRGPEGFAIRAEPSTKLAVCVCIVCVRECMYVIVMFVCMVKDRVLRALPFVQSRHITFICARLRTHTYIHTCTYSLIHHRGDHPCLRYTYYAHTCIHTCTHAHIHPREDHPCWLKSNVTIEPLCVRKYTHTYTHTCTHTHIHTCKHNTNMHGRTQAYIHTYIHTSQRASSVLAEVQREEDAARFENPRDNDRLVNVALLFYSPRDYEFASAEEKKQMQTRAIELLKEEGARFLPELQEIRSVWCLMSLKSALYVCAGSYVCVCV
jgi:hypothetical protein